MSYSNEAPNYVYWKVKILTHLHSHWEERRLSLVQFVCFFFATFIIQWEKEHFLQTEIFDLLAPNKVNVFPFPFSTFAQLSSVICVPVFSPPKDSFKFVINYFDQFNFLMLNRHMQTLPSHTSIQALPLSQALRFSKLLFLTYNSLQKNPTTAFDIVY